MSGEWWNLDQAIAWVMTRNQEIVLHFANGWIFELISYPDVFGFFTPFLGNKHDLLSSLRKGDVVSSGQCIERGAYRHERRNILPTEWQWLELNTAAPQADERVEAYGDGVASWRNIKFSVKSLKRHFPETSFLPLEEPDKQELKQVVANIVEVYKREGKTLKREILYSEVNDRLTKGRVTTDWAKEAIKEISPDLKNRRGRPPKKKSAV